MKYLRKYKIRLYKLILSVLRKDADFDKLTKFYIVPRGTRIRII